MAERKEINIPQKYKEKYGEKPRLWSYSHATSIGNGCCRVEYYLSRIKKLESEEGVYTTLGTSAHDTMESFYNGEISYDQLESTFLSKYLDFEMGDLKFCSDEKEHEKRSTKYKELICHFMRNHNVYPNKVLTEREMWVEVGDNLFFGYIDAITKVDNKVHIIDWKTSTYGNEYKNEHGKVKQMQLLLYAKAIHDLMGTPYKDIVAGWNFLKYVKVNIDYYTGKGKKLELKHKETIKERTCWVEGVKGQLKRDIKRFYPELEEFEVDFLVEDCIARNDISQLKDEIKNNYVLTDAFVEVEITEEKVNEMVEYLSNNIKIIQENRTNDDYWFEEKEDRKRNIKELEMNGEPVTDADQVINKSEEFYCNTLCGVRKHCPYYKEYLARINLDVNTMTAEEEDLLAELDNLL